LDLLFRFVVAERIGTIIVSALVAHTAWHWMIDRATVLRQYRFQWPVFSPSQIASEMRWLMLLVILGGMVWLTFVVVRHKTESTAGEKSAPVVDDQQSAHDGSF